MAEEVKPPAIVLALAEKVNGVPHAWREVEQEIVIVFKDGRKMKFAREVGSVTDGAEIAPPVVEEVQKSKKKGGRR